MTEVNELHFLLERIAEIEAVLLAMKDRAYELEEQIHKFEASVPLPQSRNL